MSQVTTHKLQVGATTLELCPQVGGSITQFYTHHDGAKVDIMRATPVDADSVLNTACFPLIPYSGRIADAAFTFAGAAVRESTLEMFAPNAIHGHGWLRGWSVTDSTQNQTSAHLTMQYQHDADGWPWSYRAVQKFELNERKLSVTLAITNLSQTTMPAGLGLHPFFPMHAGAHIETRTTGKWLSDDAVLPIQHIALDDDSPFNKKMTVDQQSLDNVFTGWCRRAAIQWPQQRLMLEMTADSDFLVIFTPPGEDYFCVEPVSHPPDSLRTLTQRKDTDDPDSIERLGSYQSQTVNPGQTLRLTMRLNISSIDQF